MEHKIREIIGLTFIGTLSLFIITEIVLAEDVFFVHPVVVLAITSVAIMLWHWGRDGRVA